MDINLVELWGQMGLPVRGVVLVLTAQAVFSLAVAVDRLFMLFRSGRASRSFAEAAAPLVEEGQWTALRDRAKAAAAAHLPAMLHAGAATFLAARERGESTERAAEHARRALERRSATLSDDLNKGMNVLASTGSTAPFVGLLGTVLGIIHAFHQIAAEGSGGIGTIGGSIGEALIVTGYGLVIAIPTVLVFNMLSSRIARFELGLSNSAGELLDRMEASDAGGEVLEVDAGSEPSGEHETAKAEAKPEPKPAAAAAN